ncbi:hypothetical protein [Mucilaginibacter pedocola]|uniref:Glycosyltransferase family 2 protein n=1 Tax=Mucilaginibacter pedocola TaxID=1792845 RepID=A0A1S9PAT0_9SPHI|nr:hypothetical protein [Mucilaginibacter pedocola]OOQ58084.1 hypothetical protein BC343_10525 [Mucilaginibacter pedocola]
MPLANKVTLQINLAPGDYPHAKFILPHQLKTLAEQVDEVLLVVDTRASKGRFAANWAENKERMDGLLEDIKKTFPITIAPVDYSPAVKKQIAEYFFGGQYIPDKDFRGGPFYAYFYGLYKASHNYVFHLDSDIFLGGGSQMWIAEAVDKLQGNPEFLVASPLPGPPHTEGILVWQPSAKKVAPYTFEFDGMSTRLFMINRSKFLSEKLSLKKPNLRSQLKAIVQGNANAELPEVLISAYMRHNGQKRVDFLGSGEGVWSLHPPYRTKDFYDNLPELIERVEQNQLPAEQQGFYDIIDAVCDWSEARAKLKANRWWKRKKF